MKKIFLLLIFIEFYSLTVHANPGDTTWVTVYNLRKLTQYGNYDTTAVFPTNKRYRKIRLHYILGRYACPSGSQYCGSWDYTTQIYARPVGKDSAEIARVITPYATDWLSLNKKHEYIVEVTDFATLLEGTTSMRFNYSGYSWGFTITLKIEFIEGVPPMDAIEVKKMYDGYFTYGNASNSIENYLTSKTFSYSAPVSHVFIKNSLSGHGSDATGCSEFCSKYYDLKLNNNFVTQKQIWRNNCGLNQVYPQTGTWIYDRSNWCPGAVVWPIYYDLTSLTTANTSFSLDIDMQSYTAGGNYGGYNFCTYLIYYGAVNHNLDVSIEDIISPTKDNNYFRNNPACDNPVIKVKNTGSSAVTSIAFEYGMLGQAPLTYTWTGLLNYLDESDLVFPSSVALLSGSVTSKFNVKVIAVNGTSGDQNLFNNIYNSDTKPNSVFPKDFIIKTLSNNSTDPLTGKNETIWTLSDANGNIILSRTGMTNATNYKDTVRNLLPGCYKFSVDDSGCDGYSWWANTAGGNGSLKFDYINGVGSVYTCNGDFGCNITKYFVVPNPPSYVGFSEISESLKQIDLFPNPASREVYLSIELNQEQNIQYSIYDVSGRKVFSKQLNQVSTSFEKIDLNNYINGIYFIEIEFEDHSRLNKKLLIQQ